MTELVDVADLKSAAIVKRRTGSTPVPGTTKLLFASPLIPLLEYRSVLSGRWRLHSLSAVKTVLVASPGTCRHWLKRLFCYLNRD